MKDILTKMVEGSIDFHIHGSPDPFVERIADASLWKIKSAPNR